MAASDATEHTEAAQLAIQPRYMAQELAGMRARVRRNGDRETSYKNTHAHDYPLASLNKPYMRADACAQIGASLLRAYWGRA